jgi:hypothetical protein
VVFCGRRVAAGGGGGGGGGAKGARDSGEVLVRRLRCSRDGSELQFEFPPQTRYELGMRRSGEDAVT